MSTAGNIMQTRPTALARSSMLGPLSAIALLLASAYFALALGGPSGSAGAAAPAAVEGRRASPSRVGQDRYEFIVSRRALTSRPVLRVDGLVTSHAPDRLVSVGSFAF